MTQQAQPISAEVVQVPTAVPVPIRVALLAASMLTVLAGAIVAPALPTIRAAFAEHPSGELLARLIVTTPALAIAFIAPVSGTIVDLFGRKRLLLGSLVLYALAGTSGIWLNSLELILVGRLLLGVAVAGVMTSATTLIGDLFVGESRGKFLGRQAASMSLAGVIFLPLGGLLAKLSWHAPFAMYVASLPIAAFAWWVLREPARIAPQRAGEVVDRLPRGIVVGVCVVAFILSAAFYVTVVQLPFHVQRVLGGTQLHAGLLAGAMTLAGGAASISYGPIATKLARPTIFGASFALMGLGYVLISAAPALLWLLPGLLIAGFGSGLFMPNGSNWLMSTVPARLRGRAVGLFTASLFAGQFASPLAVQPIVSRFNTGAAFGWVGLTLLMLLVVSSGIFVLVNRKREA